MTKNFVLYGTRVTMGSYRCGDCGYIYRAWAEGHLPPCPLTDEVPHHRNTWLILSGSVVEEEPVEREW